MLKKLSAAVLTLTVMAAANAHAFARSNDGGESDKTPATTRTATTPVTKHRPAVFTSERTKTSEPALPGSTLAEHQAQKKAGRKFSTTTKVLIGAGIAAAVLAVVFVAARNDLKDDISRW